MANVLKKILIVDDDKAMRTLLSDILGLGGGYELVYAEDGQQALEMLRQQPVDLLITDRSMPRLGGLELLHALHEEKIEIPAIVISAYGEEKLWAEAIGLGAIDYILKPFKNEEVLRVVEKHLQGPKGKKK